MPDFIFEGVVTSTNAEKDTRYTPTILAAILVVVTVILYLPALRFGFLSYDDPIYVTSNPWVKNGLCVDSVLWAFTSLKYFYHPLTWISLMIDSQASMGNPSVFHFTNILIHSINCILLFLGLLRLGFSPLGGFWIASLFAWHPVNVESVVWISERKGLLAGMFSLLALLVHLGNGRRSNSGRFIGVAMLYIASLLCKPTGITIPIVFLLLDYVRFEFKKLSNQSDANHSELRELLRESIVLMLLGATSTFLTVIAEGRAGALGSHKTIDLLYHLSNAFVSYVRYLGNLIWPSSLSAFYPHPSDLWSPLRVFTAILILSALTICAWFVKKKKAFMALGWFWFIIALLPAIGLIQVGMHSMANRYLYFPAIGIFLLTHELLRSFWKKMRFSDNSLNLIFASIAIFYLSFTPCEIWYWSNPISLFNHSLDVCADNNIIAHANLADAYLRKNQLRMAAYHMQVEKEIEPSADNQSNLAVLYLKMGLPKRAKAMLEAAVREDPYCGQAWFSLGGVDLLGGSYWEAERCYKHALALGNRSPELFASLGAIWLGDYNPKRNPKVALIYLDQERCLPYLVIGWRIKL